MPIITADALQAVSEPLAWQLHLGIPVAREMSIATLKRSLVGPVRSDWTLPNWLLPHQRSAARRVSGSLRAFGGALLCDAVGLGKTYVALAVSQLYENIVAVVPAAIAGQWRQVAQDLNVPVAVISHEALSHDRDLPPANLLIVDEAHRFRNPTTKRYGGLARGVRLADVLLVSATPVVNATSDLTHLLRIFLPEQRLRFLGVSHLEDKTPKAILPLIVSRSSRTAGLRSGSIPIPRDAPVARLPPMGHEDLTRVNRAIKHLSFPSFADRRAAELLRLHLLYRLSSSAEALTETLRRHRSYLLRALSAARAGRTLSRGASRRLFGSDDDPQLTFDCLLEARHKVVEVPSLQVELDVITELLDFMANRAPLNPKMETLGELLHTREHRKTLVFTTAIATARAIARYMNWTGVVLATGRGAAIASGPIPSHEAFEMFAPDRRGARAMPVRVLVATDLASEGLNLQAADGVVHYDVPWTPLRIHQRIGRIARLGSRHRSVGVWWFAPVETLERELRIGSRIDGKLAVQRSHGVAASSRVGTARVFGDSFERRELLLGTTSLTEPCPHPHYSLLAGGHAAIFAVRWVLGKMSVSELVGFRGSPPVVVDSLSELCDLIETLSKAEGAVKNTSPTEYLHALREVVRARLRACRVNVLGPESRRLTRLVSQRARAAAKQRRVDEITTLDHVLDQLTQGVPVGAEQCLSHVLAEERGVNALNGWLQRWARPTLPYPSVVLDAAVIATGDRQ